jgi:hypothetical protein
MRINEILSEETTLDEFSDTAPGIHQALVKRGYKFLGAGVDQSAYIEPGTGYVLKIFGTQYGSKNKFTKDQKMFFDWAKLCSRHQDNPFLPKFYGYESFKYPNNKHGELYLQIRTEQLFTNKRMQEIVAGMASYIDSLWEPATYSAVKKNLKTNEEDFQYMLKKLGKDKLKLLYKTMNKLYNHGFVKKGYNWDLHAGNIMIRKDGTPVINDPWVLDF